MSSRSWNRIVAAAIAIACACQGNDTPVEPESTRDLSPAGERLEVPSDHPGGPFYSLIGISPLTGELRFPHTEEWGAAPFQRELECVPADFNLLTVFDFTVLPDATLRALHCELTVEGHLVVETGTPLPAGLILSQLQGLGGVPLVFARWSEIEGAMADGVLTLPELLGLPSAVVGTAGMYKETFVNGPLPPGQLMLKLKAFGTLTDGRTFQLHTSESPKRRATRIEIR